MKRSIVVITVLLGVNVVGFATRSRAEEKPGPMVSLEMKDVGGEDALAQLLKAGNAKHSLDESAKKSLKDTKVTASFKEVEFNHAVDALANALELSLDKKSGDYLFKADAQNRRRVIVSRAEAAKGKSSGTITIKVTRGDGNERSFAFSFGDDGKLFGPHRFMLRELEKIKPNVFTYVTPNLEGLGSRRLTLLGSKEYTCQHCKKTSRIQTQLPATPQKCTKCQRTLQREFKFCPFDGTALPAAAGADEPKYCPYCGKEMGQQEKKSGSTAESKFEEEREIRIHL